MMKYITKESYFSISLIIFLIILFWILNSFSFVLFLLLLIFLFIFRNPNRILICHDIKAILSPIDGQIVQIENTIRKDFGECVEISIVNSFYNAGSFYAPFEMNIEEIKYRYGLFLDKESQNLNFLKEKITINAINNSSKILLEIYAGNLGKKIRLDNISHSLKVGDRLGFLINGKIKLILPKNIRIQAGLGDEIKSGSLLGYLI
ncbi:phosphatidylserine decarboxylase [Campylobacter sp. 2018MI35]|uniref:phosphatidylserine decarboxylase n=1 Tax=Campylobacter molothri TaxID=1032242 RepID=UPI00190852F7|nr:phosphatidylserine decarboxylase [Campylobacter sp. 2018MI35]MBK2000247.1 phosphatidylserine decarboxylase [Campylobacter sp. 2018MI35]MBZ7970622.1 phosphatidylserine decarboxylase [Campylobacter sp. RM3125]MBZ7970886.1 phosphatidylserine decarboxylase [Campylobacter sp. RM3124]